MVGFTELGGSKLKIGNRFLKPNFEPGPNLTEFDKFVRCIQAKNLAR